MNSSPLRIEQYETVLFNANLNPRGIPGSVTRAIQQNISSISKYPDIYYTKLKKAVAEYVNASLDHIVMGNGSTDLLKLFTALITPKKVVLLSPGPSEYVRVLSSYNIDIVYFDLKEEDEYVLNTNNFVDAITDDIDMVILCNPNNPTSKRISLEEVTKITDTCKKKNIFLIVDEMYINKGISYIKKLIKKKK